MENSIEKVISLLTEYWKDSVSFDAKTRNNCRLLANVISGRLSKEAIEHIIRQPEDHTSDLKIILSQLYKADPNTRELIKALSSSANQTSSKLQSIMVTGNSNQVITVGNDIIGTTFLQNKSIVDSEANDIAFPKQRRAAENYEEAVFISYAWGGESERIVDELELAFTERGIRIVRDKKDLGYKGLIKNFEQRIGRGQCIILVISDKYLRSEHCMYELVEVDRNHKLYDRIFPIVLSDAHIYKAFDRLTYIKYWDEQIVKLNRAIKEIDVVANLTAITADLNKYISIRSSFDHITDLLSDMNAFSPELHIINGFSILISAVERSIIRGR